MDGIDETKGKIRVLKYKIGKTAGDDINLNFWDGLSRTVDERIELGFVPLRLPVIDDVPYRIFSTTKEYRNWAEKALPEYLGYRIWND